MTITGVISLVLFVLSMFTICVIVPAYEKSYEKTEKDYMQIPEYRYLKQHIKVGTTLIQECTDITKDFTYDELYVVKLYESGRGVKVIDQHKKFWNCTYRQLYKQNFKIKENI